VSVASQALPADRLDYGDLYARWERSNWSATAIDFSLDRQQWQEQFSQFERKAALWLYALFFWGEDAVADGLSPYIEAAPTQEQKYFLATQQVDEARHAVLFARFMHEVAGLGDGTTKAGLEAIRPGLTWGFRKVFERLDQMKRELRRDPSRQRLAAAIALYHIVIEATMAQPGQHFITSYLTQRDLLPGFRAGMANVAADEQRHIGFGVKLLADLCRDDHSCRVAVADLLREVLPWTVAVIVPPGWDTNYVECFGFTLEQLGLYGIESLESKLRSAGLPIEDLPGPPVLPLPGTPEERVRRSLRLLRGGFAGEKLGPASRDPVDVELYFETVAAAIDPSAAPRPGTIQFDFPDFDPWQLRLENGTARALAGRAEHPTATFHIRFDDWVDLSAGRTTPIRLALQGRFRPGGNLVWLLRARRAFPR
jgi:hypothetical protein